MPAGDHDGHAAVTPLRGTPSTRWRAAAVHGGTNRAWMSAEIRGLRNDDRDYPGNCRSLARRQRKLRHSLGAIRPFTLGNFRPRHLLTGCGTPDPTWIERRCRPTLDIIPSHGRLTSPQRSRAGSGGPSPHQDFQQTVLPRQHGSDGVVPPSVSGIGERREG